MIHPESEQKEKKCLSQVFRFFCFDHSNILNLLVFFTFPALVVKVPCPKRIEGTLAPVWLKYSVKFTKIFHCFIKSYSTKMEKRLCRGLGYPNNSFFGCLPSKGAFCKMELLHVLAGMHSKRTRYGFQKYMQEGYGGIYRKK